MADVSAESTGDTLMALTMGDPLTPVLVKRMWWISIYINIQDFNLGKRLVMVGISAPDIGSHIEATGEKNDFEKLRSSRNVTTEKEEMGPQKYATSFLL